MATDYNFKVKNGLSVGNTEVIDSLGNIGAGGAADSSYDLKVHGLARFEGTSNFIGNLQVGGFTVITSARNIQNIGNINIGGYYAMDGVTIIDTSKNLTNIGTISSGAITSSGKVKSASLETDRYIYHAGDTNTYIDFGADEINFHAGGGANQERLIVTASQITANRPMLIEKSTINGELLHLKNTYDGGYRDDLIIENTNDRDVGITLKNLVAQYEIWMDGANDDSLIFSPGDNTGSITMELYQNKNVDIGGNLDVAGTIASGKQTITSTGTIGGATVANGYLKITDGTDTLGLDANEIMSTDRLFLNSADGEIFLRGNNSAGAKLFNGNTQFMSASRDLLSIGTISSGAITSTGSSLINTLQVGSNTQQNSYGRLQVNQSANVDEAGIGILSQNFGRSMRLWVDETDSYINSGNGGSGNLVFNQAITVSSGGNLTGVGTISSGAITTSGNITSTGNITAGTTTGYLYSKSLRLVNSEVDDTDFQHAYQMIVDANDVLGIMSNKGDFAGGNPFGIFFLGDNAATTKTLGSGLVGVWNTTNFKKVHVDHMVGLYDGTQALNIGTNAITSGAITTSGDVNLSAGNLELNGTVRINNAGNATFGTIGGSALTITNSGMPTLTLYDNGNAGGGAAEAKIQFQNTAGTAIAIGYTDDSTDDSDLIISTNAAGTYGGYLGLSAGAISDAQSDIILEPKTDVRIATGGLKIGTTTVIDSSGNLTNIGTISSGAITTSGRSTFDRFHVTSSETADSSSGINFLITDSVSNQSFTGVRIDHNASGSQAHTGDNSHYALFVDMDTTQTGGDTSNENRAYGIYSDVRGTGDTDLRYAVYGYSETQHSSGTVSDNVGVYGFAVADDTGTGHTTNNTGGKFLAYGYNTGTGGTTAHYGVYGKTLLTSAADKNTASATGVYGEIEIDTSGTATTLSNGYVFQAQFDNDSSDTTISNAFLFYGNYAGTLPSTAYGIYIADTVDNYFGGYVRSLTGFKISNTEVIDSSRNLVNIADATITGKIVLGSSADSDYLTGSSRMSVDGYIMAKGIVNEDETGTGPAAIVFGNGATYGTDQISLVTGGLRRLYIDGSGNLDFGNGNVGSVGTISSGAITASNSAASSNPLTIGSGSQTSYTLAQWKTSSHGETEAYIIAYGAGHGSEAGNFAIKNLEASSDIFFELAAGVEPLRLTSTGATFAGTISSGAITSSGAISANGNVTVNADGTGNNYLYLKRAVGGDGHLLFQEGANLRWQNVAGTNLDWYSYTHSGTTFSLGGSGGANLIVGDYQINGTTVIDSSRNLTNIAGIGLTGSITFGNNTTSGRYDIVVGSQTTSRGMLFAPYVTFGTRYSGWDLWQGTNIRTALGTTSSGIELATGYTASGASALNVGFQDLNYYTWTPSQLSGLSAGSSLTLGTPKFKISGAGDVGIGTDSAGTKLDVYDSGTSVNIIRARNATQHIAMGVNNASGGAFLFVNTNHALRFGTNGIERARIDNVGNFQIGQTTVIDSSRNLTNIANLGGGDGNFARLGRTYNTANYFEIGYGSGAVGLTINDGGGNAQITFNHTDETADSNGSSARIRCDVDSSGADILFLLEDTVTSGFVETNNMTTALTVATGGISAAGNVTAYSSDRRLKENFAHIESPLEKIAQLHGMTFDWKDIVDDLKFKPTHRKNDVGLIAQDVQAVVPQAVAPAPFDQARTEDGTGYYSKSGQNYMTVQLERLVPLLVEGIKEQSTQINAQQQQINQLTNLIKEQQQKIEKLEELVEKLISEK